MMSDEGKNPPVEFPAGDADVVSGRHAPIQAMTQMGVMDTEFGSVSGMQRFPSKVRLCVFQPAVQIEERRRGQT